MTSHGILIHDFLGFGRRLNAVHYLVFMLILALYRNFVAPGPPGGPSGGIRVRVGMGVRFSHSTGQYRLGVEWLLLRVLGIIYGWKDS